MADAGELTRAQAARVRLTSLLLTRERDDLSTAEIVTWFGAMQAQDLASGKWSFGVRMPGATEADVDAAIERREVLRTWPMRGTIHFIPPADARWMLAVTGMRALDGAARRREYLGLDHETAEKAATVLAGALSGGGRLTRSDAVAALAESGIQVSGQLGYHLLWYASQMGVTCIGPNVGNEQTFVLLDDWAPSQRRLDRPEAIAELAWRYFRSHGPATMKDFAGWTGLPMADARAGVAANDGRLVRGSVEGEPVWMSERIADLAGGVAPQPDGGSGRGPGMGRGRGDDEQITLALPGFDEFLLGYKNRSAQVPELYKNQIIPGGNGVFRATLSFDGQVVATWKRTVTKTRAKVALIPFEPLSPRQLEAAGAAFAEYGRYLGLPVTLTE